MTTPVDSAPLPGNTRTGQSRTRARLAMIGLLVCFFVPASVAWLLFFTGWTPNFTTNHGTLIEPPAAIESAYRTPAGDPIPATGFHGAWTLLLHVPDACDAACVAEIDRLRRVRLALAQHADRVRLALVSSSATGDYGTPLAHYRLADPASVASVSPVLAASAGLVLVDPRGYAMMSYAPDAEPSGLLKDLKKLLKISNLDLERLQGFVEDS